MYFQSQPLQKLMTDVLFVWCHEHEQLSYRQARPRCVLGEGARASDLLQPLVVPALSPVHMLRS